jgi:hypothetical protein
MARSSSAAADTQITRSSCGRRECLNTLEGHRYNKIKLWSPVDRRMPQHPRRPQVAFLVFETLRVSPGHRGRGVEKLTKNLTIEKMAVIGSGASSSTQRTHRSSSVGRGTQQSRCGTCQTANASRLLPDIGEPPLRSVACVPRSPGERRRVVQVKLTFEKMAAVLYIASVSILRIPPCLSVGRTTRRSGCGMWERARSSRSSRATGDCILRKVASGNRILRKVAILPRSPGERRREVN